MTEYRFPKDDMPREHRRRALAVLDAFFRSQSHSGAHCSMAILRYNAGGIGPAHLHESEVEVFFGLKGWGTSNSTERLIGWSRELPSMCHQDTAPDEERGRRGPGVRLLLCPSHGPELHQRVDRVMSLYA